MALLCLFVFAEILRIAVVLKPKEVVQNWKLSLKTHSKGFSFPMCSVAFKVLAIFLFQSR